MTQCAFFIFFILVFSLIPGEAALRTWKDQKGNSIHADFVSSDGVDVSIRTAKGRDIRLQLDSLSPTDQNYVRNRVIAQKREKVAAGAKRIDAILNKAWADKGVKPNPALNDYLFVRRIYLDVTGAIPTYDETVAFTQSTDKQKRYKLVAKLLQSEGYASHTYNYFADLLRLQGEVPGTELKLDPFVNWLKKSLHNNVPYNSLVQTMVTAQGRQWENPAAGYHLRDHGMKLDHVAYMSKAFLGTDIACAQCHDHPFDDWTQRDYYQFAAFLSEVDTSKRTQVNVAKVLLPQSKEDDKKKRKKKQKRPNSNKILRKGVEDVVKRGITYDINTEEGMRRLRRQVSNYFRDFQQIQRAYELNVYDKEGETLKLPETYQYDDGKPGDAMEPLVLFGNESETKPTTAVANSPRGRLASWMTSHENDRFATTIANHMWARYFGRGVVEPLYNVDSSKADVPALLTALTEEMVNLDFDLKAFAWMLVSTDVYNRLATQTEESEKYYFPGPVLRRMTSEQVWDSLMTLMVEDPFRFRRSDGSAYQKIVNLERDLDNMTPTKVMNRVKQFREHRELGEMIDAENDMTVREVREKVVAGKGRANKKDGIDASQMFATAAGKGRSRQVMVLARASELPQPAPKTHFLQKFGQSERNYIIDAVSRKGSIPQIMEMMNGYATETISSPGSLLFQKMKKESDIRKRADVVFLSILNRKTTNEELDTLQQELSTGGDVSFTRLIWALLNTPEFFFLK